MNGKLIKKFYKMAYTSMLLLSFKYVDVCITGKNDVVMRFKWIHIMLCDFNNIMFDDLEVIYFSMNYKSNWFFFFMYLPICLLNWEVEHYVCFLWIFGFGRVELMKIQCEMVNKIYINFCTVHWILIHRFYVKGWKFNLIDKVLISLWYVRNILNQNKNEYYKIYLTFHLECDYTHNMMWIC